MRREIAASGESIALESPNLTERSPVQTAMPRLKIESSLDTSLPNDLGRETRPLLAKPRRTLFVHRRNLDSSYDSICTRCYVTVAKADIETDLLKPEDAHICSGFELGGILRPNDQK